MPAADVIQIAGLAAQPLVRAAGTVAILAAVTPILHHRVEGAEGETPQGK